MGDETRAASPAAKRAKLAEPSGLRQPTRAAPGPRDLKAILSFQFSSAKKRLEGRVRWFDKEKGFGKIVPLDAKKVGPLDTPEEIFVHRNQIEGGPEGDNFAALAPGALVSYEPSKQDDGKPCAGNVRVQGFAKIVQSGVKIAEGAANSAREAKLRQLLLQGLRSGVFQEKGQKKVLMEDGFLQCASREVGTLGTSGKAAALALFSVMDGHGGVSCSNFVSLNLERNVLDCVREQKKRDANGEQVMRSALLAGFKVTEHSFQQYANKLEGGASRAWATSGSTCCTACFFGPDEEGRLRLLVANVGDSRAVLGKKDGFAVRLSVDHKPEVPAERRRIEQQGGTVAQFGGAHRVILKSGRGQVAAGLSVARSFGDVDFKTPAEVVTAVPEVSAFAIDPDEDVMLILSSDGVCGSISDMEAVRIASGPLREGGSDAAEQAARLLVEAAHARDASDDKTALVIWLGGTPAAEKQGPVGPSTDAEDLFGGDRKPGVAEEAAPAPQRAPGEAQDDMFADGADPVEMALLDDIFGAYARDMGVDTEQAEAAGAAVGSGGDSKEKEAREPAKKKGLSNRVAKKVF